MTFQGHVTSSVTWPLTMSVSQMPRWSFPIGAPLSPSVYLQPFSR